MSGTRVTCEDIETGESETRVIENDYVLVTDGHCYLSHIHDFPTTGTTILTIKTRKEGEDAG